jgi:hypothetical protein
VFLCCQMASLAGGCCLNKPSKVCFPLEQLSISKNKDAAPARATVNSSKFIIYKAEQDVEFDVFPQSCIVPTNILFNQVHFVLASQDRYPGKRSSLTNTTPLSKDYNTTLIILLLPSIKWSYPTPL